MTAKEFVKLTFPNAIAKKHKKGRVKGLQETYWLIRKDYKQTMCFSIGKTESNAWVNAKTKLL